MEKLDDKKLFIVVQIANALISILCLCIGWKLYEKWTGEMVVIFLCTILFGIFYTGTMKQQLKKHFIWIIGLHLFAMATTTLGYPLPAVLRPILAVPMIITALMGAEYGVLALVFYASNTILFGADPVENLLLYLIIGTAACFFVEKCKNWKKAILVGLSIIFLYAVVHNALYYYTYFEFSNTEMINGFLGGAIQTILFLLSLFYTKKFLFEGEQKEKEEEDILDQNTSPLKEKKKGKASKLTKILDFSYPPLMELKERDSVAFKHSVLVSELSSQVAKVISCDANIVKAGGLYHEIGQGLGEDYIKEGVKICKMYQIPKEVIQIVEEHNTKIAKPTSKEAAIVMLSDSIITNMEQSRKKENGENISASRLIQRVFDVKIDDGSLQLSGLTDAEINTLQEIYERLLDK